MAVSVEEAFDIIYKNVTKTKFEIVPIENAVGRICAQELIAVHSLPKFDNSAMDGYAIRFEDIGNTLKVVDKIFAGDDTELHLEFGSCAKIMTGAKIPLNTQAVVPQELVENIDSNHVKMPNDVKELQHIRFIGEDIKKDDCLIKDGIEIDFSQITLLTSQGITHIKVYKKPKVVVFSSGEELKLHYESVEDYQIYNSNTPSFLSRAQELGCEVSFMGSARDSIESLSLFIENSLDADLIVTSGGVSVGEADFTRDAFETFNFAKLIDGVKIKPGKPTVFGKIGKTLVLNLPGNPLACAMIFEMFGTVIIQKLLGSNKIYHNYINTKMSSDLKNRSGRISLVPGYFNGQNFAASQKMSPGMVSVLSSCNSFIVLDENVNLVKKNEEVKVLPISWKFYSKKEKDYITR